MLPLPDGVPLTDAALLGCAVLTGYGAVHRAARGQALPGCGSSSWSTRSAQGSAAGATNARAVRVATSAAPPAPVQELVNAGVSMVADESEPVGDQVVELRGVQHPAMARERGDHAQPGYGQRVERGVDPGDVALLLLGLVAPAAASSGRNETSDRASG